MAKSKKKEEQLIQLHSFQGTKRERLEQLYAQWYDCRRCPLADFRLKPDGTIFPEIVFGEGNPEADVLIIGEAPGEEEENTGVPFIGRSGQLLNQILAMTSADPEMQELVKWYARVVHNDKNTETFHQKVMEWRNKEFFFSNVIGCRPPENRAPTLPEVKACWERVWNLIYIIDPLLIITVGGTALKAVTGKSLSVMEHRGKLLDAWHQGHLGRVSYPVIPIFHPSYLLRTADWNVPGGDWAKTLGDMGRAMSVLDSLRHTHLGIPIPERRVEG